MTSRIRRQLTELLGQYRVFDLYRHAMVDAEGRALHDATTFDCPDWASIVPITAEGEIVLVRQYRHGIDALTLEVPGGMIDQNEEPAVAAVRELREETGYGGGELVSLGATHPNPVLQNNRHHMFMARGVTLLGAQDLDVGESCEVLRLPIDEVRAQVRDGRISHALVVLSLTRAFEALERERATADLMRLLREMEALQAHKVIDLARRLKPGLTAEDIRNPHDFPELGDTDWHFADGQLAGIQSVISALRAQDAPPRGTPR
jgi:ADP-ribose pyrophosphatase